MHLNKRTKTKLVIYNLYTVFCKHEFDLIVSKILIESEQ